MTAKTLVIGGRSRLARALSRQYPRAYDFVVRNKSSRVPLRHEAKYASSSEGCTVESYEDLCSDDMKGYSTVINLVGSTDGTPEEMKAVNAALPLYLAKEAARAGVAHFIALSSFSVYGYAPRIDKITPANPETAYGRSRLAGEANIARYAEAMACTIARCPMLYGAGDSKLERLIALWCRVGALPVPVKPVHRSMVHYDLAARYLDAIVRSKPSKPGLTIDHFADPVTFEYKLAARAISEATGQKKQAVSFPSVGFRLLAATFPQMSRSLYCDSVLDPEENYFKDPRDSRLERDLAEMASAEWGDA
jgi:nucleoside-diphosphate-sugar epimerase